MKFQHGISILMAILMVSSLSACSSGMKNPLDPNNPTEIKVWNYYNSDQLTAFNKLVTDFNSSVGFKQGIVVTSESQGNVDTLADNLIDSVNGEIGSDPVPNIASIYSETAYILNKKDILLSFDDYFTTDELNKYIPGFIEEGRLVENGPLKILPVSKSTEVFAVNKTYWAPFEEATGNSIDDITDIEALVKIAGEYYEWSDGLTPDVPEDGKCLYGRDSMANYIFIGMQQLGHQLFTVKGDKPTTDFDKASFRKLWDNFYIPYINGYFGSKGKFGSDDLSSGYTICLTGSSSGANYFPTKITTSGDETQAVEFTIKKPLCFKDSLNVAVQQGAGYSVIKGTEAENYASVVFLKWLTESDRNLEFSVLSGYSPVTKEANNEDTIKESFKTGETSAKKTNIYNSLLVSSQVYNQWDTFTTKPFEKSKAVRSSLDSVLLNIAKADRASVIAAIEGGASRSEAVSQYTTDDYFDQWYASFKTEIEGIINSAVSE
ncbi:MAG: extracellular solute-binding protein [Bacilli bacterium]